MRTWLCVLISGVVCSVAFAQDNWTSQDRAVLGNILQYMQNAMATRLADIEGEIEHNGYQDADFYAQALQEIAYLQSLVELIEYYIEGNPYAPSYDFQAMFAAISKALYGNLLHYNGTTWEFGGTNTTPILRNIREINAKMSLIPQIPEGAYSYTNFYDSFNYVIREYGGPQNEFSEEKMWLGFGQSMWDYWDADRNTSVNTNAMTKDDWIELNWYERISTALYRMVMGLPEGEPFMSTIDNSGQVANEITVAKNTADSNINSGITAFQQTVQNLTSGFTSLEGMEQPVQKLTIIPEFEWEYGGAETAVLTIPEIAIKPSESELLTKISTATRTIIQWLWRFVFFIGLCGFVFSTASGTVYFVTWVFSCASELKIKPFEWDKVFVNPFAILDFGGGK